MPPGIVIAAILSKASGIRTSENRYFPTLLQETHVIKCKLKPANSLNGWSLYIDYVLRGTTGQSPVRLCVEFFFTFRRKCPRAGQRSAAPL